MADVSVAVALKGSDPASPDFLRLMRTVEERVEEGKDMYKRVIKSTKDFCKTSTSGYLPAATTLSE
jgi:predicted RND superfamily exporter protein